MNKSISLLVTKLHIFMFTHLFTHLNHKGKNGSGKSAVLTGIVVALGERASATCRGMSIKGIIMSMQLIRSNT